MTINSKYLIVVVIATFAAALISSPIITFAIPNRSNEKGTSCSPTGKQSNGGAELVECCWIEQVPKGTGWNGGDTEMYCSECENGGSRGNINCSDPELIFNKTPITSESGGFPKDRVLEQPPNSSPNDNTGFPNNGVVEEPQLSNKGNAPKGPFNNGGEVLTQ